MTVMINKLTSSRWLIAICVSLLISSGMVSQAFAADSTTGGNAVIDAGTNLSGGGGTGGGPATTADDIEYGGNHSVTIGTATSWTVVEIDLNKKAGTLVLDSGDTFIVTGSVISTSEDGSGSFIITVGTSSGAGANLTIEGNNNTVDANDNNANSKINMTGTSGTSTLTLGKTGTTTNHENKIDLAAEAGQTVNVNLYGVTFDANTAITDTAAAANITINVLESSTLDGATDLLHTNAGAGESKIVVTDGQVLTKNGTGAVSVTSITLGTGANGAELDVGGATTITANILASAADKGTLDIDANTTIAGNIGDATNGILITEIASGTTLIVSGTVIKSKTINFAAANAELNTTGDAVLTGSLVAAGDGNGDLDIDDDLTIIGNVGSSASLDLATANIAAGKVLTLQSNTGYHVATTTMADAAAEINFTTDTTVSGIINGAGGGNGVLDVDANVTFEGVIGTNAMADIQIAADKTATFKGATVAATAITLQGASDSSTIVVGGQTSGESTTAITGNIVATGVGGVLTLMGDPSDATGHSVTGSVGASSAANYLGTINIGNNSTDADTSDVHFITINTYADTLNFAATVGGTTTVGGTAKWTAASTTAVTLGAVTTAVAGDGTMHFLSGSAAITGTITGDVGSSSAGLASILIDGSNAQTTIDFGGDVYATSMVLTHATQADATFSGTTGSTVSSVITAGADGNGDINITNTSDVGVTFTSTVGAADSMKTTNHSTATKTVFKDVVNAQTTTLTGTADVTFEKDANIFDTALTLSTAGTGTIRLGSGVLAGEIALQTAALTNITAGTKIYAPASHTSGNIIFVDDTNGDVTASGVALADFAMQDTALTDYSLVLGSTLSAASGNFTDDNTQWLISATAKSAATTASELGITESSAAGLLNANDAVAGNTALVDVFTEVLSAGGAAATQLADQVQGSPEGLSSTSGAAVAATGASVVSVGSSRMASLRTGQAYASTQGTGFNGGSAATNNSVWMKPFASFGKQTERKSIAGYDQDTYGIAIGADTRINAHSVMGVSFSFADTDVEGRGAGRAQSDISSYQMTAYGDYTAKDYYVEALVGYAYNDIDTSRVISATSATATGETSSNQFMFSLSGGMPMKAGHNSYFTPSAGINFTHVVNDSYTETGASALNLRINPEDITLAKTFLGGRYHASVQTPDGVYTPELRARVIYDMAGDDGSSSNTFTGGGAAFDNNGIDVVEFSTNIGAGLAFTPAFDQGMSLSLNYDWETKTNFNGHSANFQLQYSF